MDPGRVVNDEPFWAFPPGSIVRRVQPGRAAGSMVAPVCSLPDPGHHARLAGSSAPRGFPIS